MSFQTRWEKWSTIPPNVRWTVLEAVLMLAVARVIVAAGLRWCTPWMFRPRPLQEAGEGPPYALVQEMRFAMSVAMNHVPWRSVCLPTAIAGKLMLHRRGWPSTIHLGVGKQASGDMHAHAWLELWGHVISGADGISTVVPLPASSLSPQ